MTATDSHAPPLEAEAAAPRVRWRAVLLAAVAACAACGIVHELALLTLSASLNGGGVIATSLIVAGYVAALGAGALLVKPLLAHATVAFIAIEALLALIGGLSAAALYVTFSFIGGSLAGVVVGPPRLRGGAGAGGAVPGGVLLRGRRPRPAGTGR